MNDEWKAGKHLLIDLYDCQHHGNIEEISQIMIESCKATGATVLSHHFHPFPGGGVSGVIVLAESHQSIHTWPEKNYVALDMFVCGECDPLKALPILQKHFEPQTPRVRLVERGSFDSAVWNIT